MQEVCLPHLSFSEEALEALQHPALLQEIHDAAQRHQVDWQVGS